MVTVSNSNYNGDALEVIFMVFDTGNEIAQNAIASIETGIKKQRSLPKMSQTANPFGDYVTTAPGADTVTTTYEESLLVPKPMMLFETFLPEDWNDVWEKWQPDGDFTNATQNPMVVAAMLELYADGMGTQIANLFWQGDITLGAANPLNKFNGIITRAIADATVPKVPAAGVITVANVASILKAFWQGIPDIYVNDPNYFMCWNMTDFRLLQEANIALKEAFTGILDIQALNTYIGMKIIPFTSMPKDHILGSVTGTVRGKTNLYLGMEETETNEQPRIEKMSDGAKDWFVRIDVKADANYAEGTELLLYKPA